MTSSAGSTSSAPAFIRELLHKATVLSAIGSLHGMALRQQHERRGNPPTISLWVVAVGGVFGTYFCTASLWLALGAGAGN